jgi:hypothetical protein
VLRPDALPVTELIRRYEAASIDMRYYTPELHQASFALPRFLEDAVDVATRGDQTPSSIRMNRMNERRSNQLAESL